MGGSISGDSGNTKGSSLDALSNLLTATSLIPVLDTFTNLASIPVDLARGDFVDSGDGTILSTFPCCQKHKCNYI